MDWLFSLIMLALLMLLGGAVAAWRRGARQHALLMAGVVLVIAANLAIWMMPLSSH